MSAHERCECHDCTQYRAATDQTYQRRKPVSLGRFVPCLACDRPGVCAVVKEGTQPCWREVRRASD